MALNPDNVLTGIFTGGTYWAPLGTQLPTGFNQDLESMGYTNLGFITDDGAPALTLPGEGENTPVRVWQNAQVIRNVRTASEESPTFTFTLAETTRLGIETALGATIGVDGSYVINGSVARQHGVFVLDVLSAEGGRRYVAPNAVVTETGEISFPNDGSIVGLPVTVSADFSTLINGQIQVWDTAFDPNGGLVPPPIDPGEPETIPGEVDPEAPEFEATVHVHPVKEPVKRSHHKALTKV